MFERCLYFNVNALARRVNAIWDAAFAEFKLSPAHAYLLRLVLETPALTQGQIAAELKLEKSTVTRFVTALENRQLVRRQRQGREVRVLPTARATELASGLDQTGDALYQQLLTQLGEQELLTLVAQLRASGRKLSKHNDT